MSSYLGFKGDEKETGGKIKMMLNIHCNTINQFKVLRHLQNEFEPCAVIKLALIENGIRLTDYTGESGDFVFENGKVVLRDTAIEQRGRSK